jgi:CheY-like chemotaxis protein
MVRTALVVEDEVDVASVLVHHLHRDGYACTTVTDGESATRLAESQRFDLAVVDVVLPGIDGSQVIDTLRRSPGGSDLPIVATTVLPPWKLFDLASDALLRKPFRSPDVRRAVERACAAHRADREERTP